MTIIGLIASLFMFVIALDIVFTLHSIRNSLKYTEKCMAWLVKAVEIKSGGVGKK